MVSPKKVDVMLAKRAEQHKKADAVAVPARRVAVELLKRVAATARVALAKRAVTACSVVLPKKVAVAPLKRADATARAALAKRVAVALLRRASLKKVAIAARRADTIAFRCSLA